MEGMSMGGAAKAPTTSKRRRKGKSFKVKPPKSMMGGKQKGMMGSTPMGRMSYRTS